MSINTDMWELLILRKNVIPSHFYDVIEKEKMFHAGKKVI